MAEEPPATSHLDPASRRVGTVLDGKWTLDRLLGVGGMAAVYAGTHRNGARAAIKLFPFSVTTSAESAERILREGYLANKIGHPAVVQVLDDHLDREREYAYLVMELLEGETARQRVERTGPMSPIEAAGYMIDLASALAVAHAKGVVHRDIKPENLFLTRDGHLKILDFGVARALDGSSSSVTRTGATLWTPAYMSPEQARGRPSEISARSDLYSTGATLLFLLAGEFMHPGESAQEVMVRAAWTPAEKIASRHLGIPDVIATIIDRACEFEPEDRYGTALELKEALEEASRSLAGDPEASRPLPRPSSAPAGGPAPSAPGSPGRTAADAASTIADDAAPPPGGATPAFSTEKSRLATWWVGAGLTAVVASLLLVLWPRASDHSDGHIQARDRGEAGERGSANPTAPGAPRMALAGPSAPAAPARAPEPAQATAGAAAESAAAAPPPPTTRPHRPGTSTGSTIPARRATSLPSAATKLPASALLPAAPPATRTPVTGTAKASGPSRDVGY
jgi:serine/threonine protein kinase